MKRSWIMSASVLVLAARVATAQDGLAPENGMVIVTRDVCARLQVYQPAPDVAYQPGVDVEGNPVAPADLPGSNDLDIDLDDIAIDPRIPLARFHGDPDAKLPVLGEAEIDVGRITFREGRPYLGGRPLRSAEEHALATECARLHAESRRPEMSPVEEETE